MDAVLFSDLMDFKPLTTYVSGARVAEAGVCLTAHQSDQTINCFNANPINVEALRVPHTGAEKIRVIEAMDGELLTNELQMEPRVVGQNIEADPERDLLQLMVLNRYQPEAKPALAFIKGFGLKCGAMASTVAHDSHNIIAVGCSREEIARAVNALVESGGGIALCDGEAVQTLPLPVAGLMSVEPAEQVAQRYEELSSGAKALGSTLRAPYMTLSFMALLVIPELKLSDKGLFDGVGFGFVELGV